jgi:hypothetical protein
MKSIGIVSMHLEKMLLKYEGVVPTRSGSRGLRRGGHHGPGGFMKMARIKSK